MAKFSECVDFARAILHIQQAISYSQPFAR